jgi:hypothetical protein
VNVEANENVVFSRIVSSLQEQYCEVLQNARDFSIFSGLNNEIRLPCSKEWILDSHGGGWSDDALRVNYTRSNLPNHLIHDGTVVYFLLLSTTCWTAHHLFSI